MSIRARIKATKSSNIFSGWRDADLAPSDPRKVLDRLPRNSIGAAFPPVTPPEEPNLELLVTRELSQMVLSYEDQMSYRF